MLTMPQKVRTSNLGNCGVASEDLSFFSSSHRVLHHVQHHVLCHDGHAADDRQETMIFEQSSVAHCSLLQWSDLVARLNRSVPRHELDLRAHLEQVLCLILRESREGLHVIDHDLSKHPCSVAVDLRLVLRSISLHGCFLSRCPRTPAWALVKTLLHFQNV